MSDIILIGLAYFSISHYDYITRFDYFREYAPDSKLFVRRQIHDSQLRSRYKTLFGSLAFCKQCLFIH